MQFTSAAFVRAYGRPPRGYGNWAFRASTTRVAYDADLVGETLNYFGTLTDAKAAVKPLLADASFVAVLS